jgi:hypothetical protein
MPLMFKFAIPFAVAATRRDVPADLRDVREPGMIAIGRLSFL